MYGDGDGCHADTIGCCHHLESPLMEGKEKKKKRKENERKEEEYGQEIK